MKSFESRDRRHVGRSESRKDDGTKAFDEDEFIKTGRFSGLKSKQDASLPEPKRPRIQADGRAKTIKELRKERDLQERSRPKKGERRFREEETETKKKHVLVPESVPYATPASEFIYGTSAVEAALRSGRRQLYKLYIHQGDNEELGPTRSMLRKLALTKNITVKMAYAGWDRLFDKMSSGRPHNGCILDASPLPQLPVKSLCAVSTLDANEFSVVLAPQSKEEAVVNSTNNRLPVRHLPGKNRFPVVLLLDGITDTGNLGGIIRSAYYLGIDAIVFAGRNCAPLSPVTIKASAGAAENMPLIKVSNEVDFIQQSKANGWRFFAADAPVPGSSYPDTSGDVDLTRNALTQAPSVIMLGSEGYGLSAHIKSHADSIVSIPGARVTEWGFEKDPARVDSLNVSVAAAILMEQFLRVPILVTEAPPKKTVNK
jgi:predicted rRNA methylase